MLGGTLATVGLLAVAAAAPNHKAAVKHHRCETRRCHELVDPAWGRRNGWHPPHRDRTGDGSTMVASYFGGGAGACGGGSWGVASKTLPCHTRLTICAQSCAVVPVTDRGPYVPGRELDLTEAVARAIGFPLSAGVASVRVSIG